MRQSLFLREKMCGMVMFIALISGGCGSSAASQDPATAETGGDSALVNNEAAPLAAAAQSGCQADADCVPDACCHPKGCVPISAAPQGCDEVMCTGECKEGTMDCQKGSCACTDGVCGVKWSE